jgi:hypothetical protein
MCRNRDYEQGYYLYLSYRKFVQYLLQNITMGSNFIYYFLSIFLPSHTVIKVAAD